ncbi:hypothetical protein C8Q80DRAFT_1310856 [Daedaleopsis nitida]|nr:hypothetical protein C8Q80DRAFT_1310856 [Daedaleopsis nitida]
MLEELILLLVLGDGSHLVTCPPARRTRFTWQSKTVLAPAQYISAAELGTERVKRVIRACQSKMFTVALPRGIAEARDRTLMQQTEHGFAELKFSSGADQTRSSVGLVPAIEGIFPYDPVDEADNWIAHAGARDAHSHIGHDRPARHTLEHAEVNVVHIIVPDRVRDGRGDH